MEKNINLIKKYFRFSQNVQNIFIKQITNVCKENNSKKNFTHNYKIGDDVLLNKETLLHGTRVDVKELEKIKKTGLIAPEFFKPINKYKKKPWVVEFWKTDKKILLKDFIDIYCGVTIEVKNNKGAISKRIITSVNKIEEELLNLDDYRDYIIYQNQEQRFMPNKFNKTPTMAFIVNDIPSRSEVLKNNIFSQEFDKKIVKKLLPKWYYKKYIINQEYDNNETTREKAILYGIPSSFIDGILVNTELENNENELNQIKKYFPNCYICNIDGKVIKD